MTRILDCATALLAFGARAAIVIAEATAASLASTATAAPTTATLAALIAFTAELTLRAKFGAGLTVGARATIFTAETAVTPAAASTAAVPAMTVLTIAFAVTASALVGGRPGFDRRTAEEAFQPTQETTRFFLRRRLGLTLAIRLMRAGLEFAFFPRFEFPIFAAWLARIARSTGLLRIAGLARFKGPLLATFAVGPKCSPLIAA